MNVSVLEQYQKLASTNRSIFYGSKSKYSKTQPASQLHLMQAVIESFVDGIFVITAKGELVHANERAGYICEKLSQNIHKGEIPAEIRRICDSLIESRQLFPNQKISLESEIKTRSLLTIRVRVRWLQANGSNNDYIIVTLEDREQTNQSIAISEAKKYGLTERETDVWLLRRANYSYQEIAEELYITINTVKKHLKNIYAKQQEAFID
ncbi:response regulator containing a CheY-like receiver domain and an HTH DNA-binding domain [Rivularia sp. PCC 7116]|uniref:helix-turn-helix transcriptional regulator n=1 Tax=Rivularia sp. PCC 7116 TaxID=373994 RepID=UPI00029F152F|nr:helix-turn-helix transcriptional regulator [Rivularia sp. PCC 7116]AFY53555.1 response regulator containing a CheY-like receiver domain and an HTH DNA-binding domain [Rivularia sp. PCC 7116]